MKADPNFRSFIVKTILGSTLFVAAVLALLYYFGAQQQLQELLSWFDAQGAWGPILFVIVMALVVIFLLPGVMLTTGAGFVFGVPLGAACVVAGTTLGAAAAFVLARHGLQRPARYLLNRYPKVSMASDALASEGFKFVLLTRLVPFFPFKASNYFFGLARFSLRDFTAGTFLGIIPFSVHNVYLGAIASDIATLGARHGDRTPLQWSLYGMGFLLALGALIALGRIAHRTLARYAP
ncbi:MAG: TVP38/TMEM64 family protein [Burkholderiales bacterium]